MSDHDLFVSQANIFSGIQTSFEKADYVVFGVPFDVTSTYRTGARFGPNAIRQASLNIETCSFRTGLDVEDLKIHDLGDLHVSADTVQTLHRVEGVTRSILDAGKVPIMIGGEHTITLGSTKGLGSRSKHLAVVSFDAHLDLRDEFMGLKLSHTTFMRRISEEVRPAKVIEIGTRAVCKEELEYAKEAKIAFFTAYEMRKQGSRKISRLLKAMLSNFEYLYVSVDMDVVDPAYAPAVQNPEPEGIEPYTLLDLLASLCDKRIVGFDALEIAPDFDKGISAIQTARVIFEIMCYIEKGRKG